jgi:hypothetical protein
LESFYWNIPKINSKKEVTMTTFIIFAHVAHNHIIEVGRDKVQIGTNQKNIEITSKSATKINYQILIELIAN